MSIRITDPILAVPNQCNYRAIPTQGGEALLIEKELEDLINEARMCRIATKLAGCVCLPFTWSCVLPNLCCRLAGCCGDEWLEPTTWRHYSGWTACDGGSSWAPRLPPRDKCEQILHIFDPYVCCVCLATAETAQHYLPLAKQRRLAWLVNQERSRAPQIAREVVRNALTREGRVPDGVVSYVLEYGGRSAPSRQLMDEREVREAPVPVKPWKHDPDDHI